MELAERLKERRTAYNMTQQQVADEIGVDVSTYAHYESGRRRPDIKRLRLLCRMFNIAIEDHFPLVRNLEFPPELLRALSETKNHVSQKLTELEAERDDMSPPQKFHATGELLDQLEKAIAPVQKIWEETMSAPEMDIQGLPDKQTIMRVNFNPADWQLLSESLRLQNKLYNFMFQ